MTYNSISPYVGSIPFFSVILCTYNRATLIHRAIDSLLHQTESDWELLIVDDGSNDGTFQSVQPYLRAHANIRYMYHANRGLGASRNAGLLASAGLFITFLDSDDEYLPEHLAIRKEALTQNPTIPFIHGGVEIIGNEFVPDKDNTGAMIHLSECVIGGTFVVRRTAAIELGGFPTIRFADDAEFYEHAVAARLPIAKIDAPTYRYYRDTPDSLCNMMEAGQIQ